MGPTLASPDEEYWAALTQWKTAGMLVDSGCTDHIVTNVDAFLYFLHIQSVVKNPNGEASRVVGRGCMRISIPSIKGEIQCELQNVLCVPDYSSTLLSVSKCTEWGHSFTLEKENSCMKLQKGTRVKLTQENKFFNLPCSVLEFKMSSNSVKLDSARKWNTRLGHLNQLDVVRNAPETVGELNDVCNLCALAKIKKTPVPSVAETQAEEKLERVFADVIGPFRVESLSGFRFYIVFGNQYTKFVFVDMLKAKSETLASRNKFVLSVGTPKKLRPDNAKEFLSEQFKMYGLDTGILEEKTIAEMPQQNGLAEWCNGTLLEIARSLLIDSGLPNMMWGAAILHATRIKNLVVRRGELKRPTELMWGLKPKFSIGKLSIFGLHSLHEESGQRCQQTWTQGTGRKVCGLHWRRQWIPDVRTQHTQGCGSSRSDHQGVRSGLNPWQHRDTRPTRWGVTANGDPAPRWWSSRRWQPGGAGYIYCNKGGVALRRERELSRNDTEKRRLWWWGSSTRWRIYCNKRESQRLGVTGRQWNGGFLTDSWLLWRRTGASGQGWAQTRDTSKESLALFGEVRTYLAVTEGDYVEPKTVYEAKQGDDWDQCHRAMKDEVKALQDNETWNLVRPLTDRDVTPCKWVFKVKLGPRGQVDKYKARYVAKGFKQTEGLDYFETFATTCKPETLRTSTISEARPCDAPVWCQDGLPALINRGKSVPGTATGVCKTRIRWRKVSMPTE